MIIINNENDLIDKVSTKVFDIPSDILETVSKIVNDVKKNGIKAVKDYTYKFDRINIDDFKVSANEIERAYNNISADYKSLFARVVENIENYQTKTLAKSWIMHAADKSLLGEIITPIDSVCLYIPAGTAPLVSTIFMSVIPARIAGVKKIYITTPPDKNGNINDYILAAAKFCGVSEIYKIGGAQAIAAFAFGVDNIPKCDKIIGPGNIYVAAAKKIICGYSDIDMIAGPSEILVLADDSANTDYVIADLLSQAEHDILAGCYLVTTSKKLGEQVSQNILIKSKSLARQEIIEKSLNNLKIYLTNDLDLAAQIVNKIAPEHLEVCVAQPELIIRKIKNAGAIFIGNYTPEAVGDYYAGPSHILPTAGTARFYSPVSTATFIKKSSLIWYSKQDTLNAIDDIAKLAALEGLTAHKLSAEIRKS